MQFNPTIKVIANDGMYIFADMYSLIFSKKDLFPNFNFTYIRDGRQNLVKQSLQYYSDFRAINIMESVDTDFKAKGGEYGECEECDNDGVVDFEYTDRNGYHYEVEHECPVCEGYCSEVEYSIGGYRVSKDTHNKAQSISIKAIGYTDKAISEDGVLAFITNDFTLICLVKH